MWTSRISNFMHVIPEVRALFFFNVLVSAAALKLCRCHRGDHCFCAEYLVQPSIHCAHVNSNLEGTSFGKWCGRLTLNRTAVTAVPFTVMDSGTSLLMGPAADVKSIAVTFCWTPSCPVLSTLSVAVSCTGSLRESARHPRPVLGRLSFLEPCKQVLGSGSGGADAREFLPRCLAASN